MERRYCLYYTSPRLIGQSQKNIYCTIVARPVIFMPSQEERFCCFLYPLTLFRDFTKLWISKRSRFVVPWLLFTKLVKGMFLPILSNDCVSTRIVVCKCWRCRISSDTRKLVLRAQAKTSNQSNLFLAEALLF